MKLPNNTDLKPLTQQEIDSIITFYGAWKLKQPDLLDDVVTPDCQDIRLGPGQADGPQGLKDIINYFTAQCPDVEIEIHEIFGSHERAGVRAAINFTHDAEILGIAPSGKKVSVALHEFHYLKDGKLTHTWHLEDWFSLIEKDTK